MKKGLLTIIATLALVFCVTSCGTPNTPTGSAVAFYECLQNENLKPRFSTFNGFELLLFHGSAPSADEI